MKKTILITGGSRGIGRETVRLFARQGYNVAFCFNQSQDQAKRLVDELANAPGQIEAVQTDVADRAQVEGMFDRVLARFGRIDVLVNNAGVAQNRLFFDITDDEWRRLFAVDVDGVFFCCRRAAQDMLSRKQGKIINISSVWGLTGASCEVHYSAAKAAVIGMTRALAKELGPSGIRVNCVAPGVIDTDMNADLTPEDRAQLCEQTPLGRLGTPADIAACVWYLASPAGDFITGQVISPNGGFVIG